MITYVQFREPVSVGGDFASINAWSAEKHRAIECVEKGNWIVLSLPGGGTRRVPMSNVAFISDDGKEKKP